MADLTLADVAFGLGLLTAVFAFHWRFVRPGLVGTVKWRAEMEARMSAIEDSVRRHEAVDERVLAAIKGMESDIGEIKKDVAVLKDRSERRSG